MRRQALLQCGVQAQVRPLQAGSNVAHKPNKTAHLVKHRAASLLGLPAAGTGVLGDHDLVHAPPAAATANCATAGTWAVRLRARRLSKPASANTLRVSAAQKSVAAASVGARRGAWWSRPSPTLRGVDLHSRHRVRAKAERPSHRCRRHLDGGSSLPGRRRYCARACRTPRRFSRV